MIELSREVYHAKCEGALADIGLGVDEHIVVGSILLEVCIFNRTWDIRISDLFTEWLSNLGAKLSVPFRDVIKYFKSSIVQCFDSVFEQGPFTSLLAEFNRAYNFSHIVREL